MKSKTIMFALPIVGLLIGGLMQGASAQTYSYTRTVTTSSYPTMTERIVEDPVVLQDEFLNRSVTIERPVTIEQPITTTIERPVLLERPTVIERPVVIKDHPHHAFHLGVFPLGALDLF